jgi:MoxR-like ATPase
MKIPEPLQSGFPESGTSIPADDPTLASTHIWDQESWLAVQAAVCTGRPLLLRGEPGVGKTQLAQALAAVLQCPIVPYTCDVTTELTDLLWKYDAVARMGEAQMAAIRCPSAEVAVETVREELKVMNFVTPGPFWWGLSWDTASGLKRAITPVQPENWKPGRQGCLVLIDEIDKAESEVPNGLLEVLSAGCFRRPDNSVVKATSPMPMVVFTSNEERNLPEAFLRRCIVHTIAMPDDPAQSRQMENTLQHNDVRSSMRTWLEPRVRAHVAASAVPNAVLAELINVFCDERQAARSNDRRPPGLAELLDLVGCFVELKEQGHEHAWLLERLRTMILSKPVPTWLQ